MADKPKFMNVDDLLSLWLRRSGFHGEMNAEIIEADKKSVLLKLPFNNDFCADAAKELIHGGVLTAFMDSAFGLATNLSIPGLQRIVTLDLRVEYLRPAKSRSDLLVFAECYRQTRHIAFNRGHVWFDGDDEKEVATGYAAFALTRGENLMVSDNKEKNVDSKVLQKRSTKYHFLSFLAFKSFKLTISQY